jgi:predicted nucleic acid-binding protein
VIVLDASVLLEIVLETHVGATLVPGLLVDETLSAPHLIDIEVAQVIRRWVRAGDVSAARGELAIEDLADFPIIRYPHTKLLPRVWELRANLTAYDAVYVALAEVLDATLLTRDARLYKNCRRYEARVELL